MRKLSGERGLGIIDTLIALVLISIMIGVLIPRYQRLAQEAQETALKIGLGNIRKGIMAYVLINQRLPTDLRNLLKERIILPVREDTIFTTEYLRTLALDPEGFPVDSFGNRYAYDSKTGRVNSTTQGYETW